VEVDLKQKGTPLHDASVVGDTVGDPFKDTSSVALNPVIKFTTLFGLLAVELAVSIADKQGQFGENGPLITHIMAAVFFLASLVFVWRSFHKMRIGNLKPGDLVGLNPQPEPPGITRPE
jgi:K(+)-stimulated pyrophosphate-energized sodium pump